MRKFNLCGNVVTEFAKLTVKNEDGTIEEICGKLGIPMEGKE